MDRKSLILKNIDKNGSIGIEIGPFHNPIAPKREGWNTIIIDYTDGTELRRIANNHSDVQMRKMASNIEDVDIVWKSEPLEDLIDPKLHGKIDYIISSHNIEHVPNILSFFKSVEKLLKKGGILSMAVPDMRYTFDFFLNPSTLGDVLEANRKQAKRHSPETLLDCRSRNAHMNNVGCWAPLHGKNISIRRGLKENYAMYLEELSKIDYIDCHSWYFTVSSFQLLCTELRYLGLINLTVSKIDPPIITKGSEFIVQLKISNESSDTDEHIYQQRSILMKMIVKELAERVEGL